MAGKAISPEVLEKVKGELADLRNRKQQIDLALKNPSTMGTEYTVEDLEKESVTLGNEINRLVKDFGLD